jgi:hypothetical protein
MPGNDPTPKSNGRHAYKEIDLANDHMRYCDCKGDPEIPYSIEEFKDRCEIFKTDSINPFTGRKLHPGSNTHAWIARLCTQRGVPVVHDYKLPRGVRYGRPTKGEEGVEPSRKNGKGMERRQTKRKDGEGVGVEAVKKNGKGVKGQQIKSPGIDLVLTGEEEDIDLPSSQLSDDGSDLLPDLTDLMAVPKQSDLDFELERDQKRIEKRKKDEEKGKEDEREKRRIDRVERAAQKRREWIREEEERENMRKAREEEEEMEEYNHRRSQKLLKLIADIKNAKERERKKKAFVASRKEVREKLKETFAPIIVPPEVEEILERIHRYHEKHTALMAIAGINEAVSGKRQSRQTQRFSQGADQTETKRKDDGPKISEMSQGYGEIGNASLQRAIMYMVNDVSPPSLRMNSGSTFVDVGSGFGKVCWYVSVMAPMVHVRGIEINKARYDQSIVVLKGLVGEGLIDKKNNITLLQADATSPDVQIRETHVYMFDLLFNSELETTILNRMQPTLLLNFQTPKKMRNMVGDRFKLIGKVGSMSMSGGKQRFMMYAYTTALE